MGNTTFGEKMVKNRFEIQIDYSTNDKLEVASSFSIRNGFFLFLASSGIVQWRTSFFTCETSASTWAGHDEIIKSISLYDISDAGWTYVAVPFNSRVCYEMVVARVSTLGLLEGVSRPPYTGRPCLA